MMVNMRKLDARHVKEYFKRGTVLEWWNPEVESKWVTKYDKHLYMKEKT
jgi:hypothetical protein